MTEEKIKNFEIILENQNQLLDHMKVAQAKLRKAVMDKDWKDLTKVISEINLFSDSFQQMDKARDEIQVLMSADELHPYVQKLMSLRNKLSACKIENKALGDYLTIARGFIDGVINNALPSSRAKVYTRTGAMMQKKPESVVLSTLM